MTSRLEASRKLLAIYFDMFDSECPPEMMQADDDDATEFCNRVRHKRGIQVDDLTILADNAIEAANAWGRINEKAAHCPAELRATDLLLPSGTQRG